MSAGINDYFTKVGDPGNATFLASPGHSIGGASWTVDSTGLWPTDTAVIFAVDRVTVVGDVTERVAGSYTVWRGLVTSATTIGSAVLMYGTDQNYAASSSTRVYILPTSSRENRIVDGLLAHIFDQDATMKAGAVDNAAALASNVVTTAKILDAAVTLAKLGFTVSTQANAGSAGGTMYYINLGGIKLLWGSTASTSVTGSGFQHDGGKVVTFPTSFFSTIQTAGSWTGPASNSDYIYAVTLALSASAMTTELIQVNGGNAAAAIYYFVMGT